MELNKVDKIIDAHGAKYASLVSIMQDVQDEATYLPRAAVERISERLDVPLAQVYRLATFFESFHLEPRGEHICTVCVGTSCHVRGAPKLVKQLEQDLKIPSGGTTKDNKFTIEEVHCVGACAVGPLVIVDDQVQGKMTGDKLHKVIETIGKKPAKGGK
jgi:NADH-quinone oxidoreductase subunit E